MSDNGSAALGTGGGALATHTLLVPIGFGVHCRTGPSEPADEALLA